LDKPVWFNFDEDILFFKNCSAINSFFLSSVPGSIQIQRSQIQLAFDYDMTDAFTKVRFLMLGSHSVWCGRASLLVLCHQNLEKVYFERGRAPIANVHNYNQEVLVLRTSYEHFIQLFVPREGLIFASDVPHFVGLPKMEMKAMARDLLKA
jgi:hypothetical protein